MTCKNVRSVAFYTLDDHLPSIKVTTDCFGRHKKTAAARFPRQLPNFLVSTVTLMVMVINAVIAALLCRFVLKVVQAA